MGPILKMYVEKCITVSFQYSWQLKIRDLIDGCSWEISIQSEKK